MGFKLVFLYTDIAVGLLLVSGILFLLYARKREQYRIAWRQLRVRKLPLICLGVLMIYALIGVLDSVHFQKRMRNETGGTVLAENGTLLYETGVLSVLDLMLQDLRAHTEKSFSAPFSTHLFGKENIELPDGSTVRGYPRLTYGGSHLESPEDASQDIFMNVLKGLALGLLLGAVATALCVAWFAWQAKRRNVETTSASLRPEMIRGVWMGSFLTVVAILGCVVALLATRYHVFGTDKVGQDVLYTALKGCRTGLIVGTITTLIVTPFALVLGVAAGYFGKFVDDTVQYIYTTLASIPGILLIAAAMLIVQTGMSTGQSVFAADRRLLWLCVVLGITGWTGLCRLLRGETLKLREVEYVQAAHAFGVSHAGIMFRHIVPNLMHIVLISIILRFSGLVLAEAVLAYVGIGVDVTTESWGNMINAARLEISRDPVVWWNILAAFLFMFGLVLPANVFGDAVRDALDPRLRTE